MQRIERRLLFGDLGMPAIVGAVIGGLIIMLVIIFFPPKPADYRPVVKVEKLDTSLKKRFGLAVAFMPVEKQVYPYKYLYFAEDGSTFRSPESETYLQDHSGTNGYPGDAVWKTSIGGAGTVSLYIASDNLNPNPKYLRVK